MENSNIEERDYRATLDDLDQVSYVMKFLGDVLCFVDHSEFQFTEDTRYGLGYLLELMGNTIQLHSNKHTEETGRIMKLIREKDPELFESIDF